MLAGGAYVGYKLGKAVGSFGSMGMGGMGYGYGNPYMMPYHYGPYYSGYSPYHSSPFMFSGQNYNRYAYRTQACYECSSVDGDDGPCEQMDDQYSMNQLERYRHVCPAESYCAVVVGRVFPKVDGPAPQITNETDPDTLKQYEGKDFVRRVCQPKAAQEQQKCDYCPTPKAGQQWEGNCDIFMCNVCDTEACNSWGIGSMPDKRYYSSGMTAKSSILLFALLLVVAIN